MTDEPWNKHTPGEPMPCKCGGSLVKVKLRQGEKGARLAKYWDWRKHPLSPDIEITDWRFVERKGEDVIATTTGESYAIRSAARRANIEVPE